MFNESKGVKVVCLFLMGLVAHCCNELSAQTNTGKSNNESKHLTVYTDAVQSGDYLTAITALSYYVAENPGKANYKDSLAFLYYLSANYHQCIYWCNVLIKKGMGNHRLLEIKAASLKLTGQYTDAIYEYEQLLRAAPNPVYAYNLMELQYQLKRHYECIQTSGLIEQFKYEEQMQVNYKTEDNRVLQTPLKTALYNLVGLTYLDLGKYAESKTAFEKALSIDTSCVMVKLNLEKLNALTSAPNKEIENSTNTKGELKKD